MIFFAGFKSLKITVKCFFPKQTLFMILFFLLFFLCFPFFLELANMLNVVSINLYSLYYTVENGFLDSVL